MTPRGRRITAIGAAIAALVLAIWLLTGGGPEAQSRAMFERLKTAVEDGDASGVVGELHPRYDFAAMWPGRFGSGGEAATFTGDSDPRALARRGIAFIFYQRGANKLRFSYRIERVTEQPDGTVAVDATIDVASQDGGGRLVSPKSHHWILAKDGWRKLRILSHDPIEISL